MKSNSQTEVDSQTIRQVVQKIDDKTDGFLAFNLNNRFNLCSECLSPLYLTPEKEKVCSGCGVVVRDLPIPHAKNIFIGDDHKPTNQLSFGRDQGVTLHTKGTWSVIAQSRGSIDLPISAKQISILVQKHDHPKVEQMLRIGNELIVEYDLFPSHKTPGSVRFSNLLGRIIRTVGAWTVLYNDRTPITDIAKACFLTVFRYLDTSQSPSIESLGIDPDLFHATYAVFEQLSPLRQGR